MWKQKIGISMDNSYGISNTDVVKMLSQIGFDAISPEWEYHIDMKEFFDAAKEYGVEIQSFHAPFAKAADMWSKDPAISVPAKQELLDCLEDCHRYNVPVMVVHTWIGFEYEFEATEEGFKNHEEVVAKAAEYGVKIAYENTEGEEYLYALMEHFAGNETVGFCWDSGHEMCYNHSQDLLDRFGDRLIMTHLNDNLGISRFDGYTFWTDDLHLLPYDGIADWDYNIERMRNAKHLDSLNFELNIMSKPERHENDIYGQMSLELYFTEAYKRACKIAYRYAK